MPRCRGAPSGRAARGASVRLRRPARAGRSARPISARGTRPCCAARVRLPPVQGLLRRPARARRAACPVPACGARCLRARSAVSQRLRMPSVRGGRCYLERSRGGGAARGAPWRRLSGPDAQDAAVSVYPRDGRSPPPRVHAFRPRPRRHPAATRRPAPPPAVVRHLAPRSGAFRLRAITRRASPPRASARQSVSRETIHYLITHHLACDDEWAT